MITSRQNQQVRLLRRLHDARGRREEGLYLLEGPHLVAEALAHHVPLALVATSPRLATRPDGAALLEALDQVPRWEMSDELLEYASEGETPQGVLAAATLPQHELLPGPLVLLDGLQDPGNVGTIIRTAAAAGAGGVLYRNPSADPFGPKCVRASAGVVAWFPVRQTDTVPALPVLAARARSAVPYTDAGLPWQQPFVLAIGSEAHGLSPQVEAAVTHFVCIPMARGVESLNAAIAAAVLLFHARSKVC
ncbi:MAG: TrmH family RNA methyltransferase [Candidatus Xenobia bacterium]